MTTSTLGRDDLGFLLAKATQRWNELLAEAFVRAGYADVRPSYGSVLLPLFEEDGLQMGELGRRSRLSKQTMTHTRPPGRVCRARLSASRPGGRRAPR